MQSSTPYKFEFIPDSLQHAIKVPLVVGTDRDIVLHSVDYFELLEGYLVYLVQDVQRRDVDAIPLYNIHELCSLVAILVMLHVMLSKEVQCASRIHC
jgi:hypothetical protein